MIASFSSIWNSMAVPGMAALSAPDWALLILLGTFLLASFAVRELYFKIWIVGWAVFAASRLGAHNFASRFPAPFGLVTEQASFVLAVGLLAGAVLLYAHSRELIVPLAVVTPILVGFAGARVLLWPDSVPLRMAVEVGYRIVLLTAALALLRARRGRWEPTAWLLAASLLTLHLAWGPFTDRLPESAFVAAEIALGVSMLMVALSQARTRTRRLRALQAITQSTARAPSYGSMVQPVLEELQRLYRVRAAWFRLIDSGSLVATHAVGLSADFLRNTSFTPLTEALVKLFEDGEAKVAARDASPAETPESLKAEKIRQLVAVPVKGNKAAVGLLLLGESGSRQWTTEELEFLETCAKQLAIAIENSRLLEQVLRSQSQWMNTFDSVHDVILAHDSEFRIIKANQVLLEQLGQAAADVIGSTCESTLPHTFGEWTGCPYCATRGDEEFTEGADPCFGGFSVVSTSSYSEQETSRKGIIHVVRDISDRRSAEEKYRLLFEQVQEGVYVATPAGKLIDCNDALVHMLGYVNREELLVLNLNSEICVDPRQRENFRREMESHNYVRNFEVTLRRKDGTVLLAVESSFATRDGNGAIERYQGFVLDMTEKRRAEDEMRRRNRELNALNAMAVVAAQSFDLDEILNLTLRQVVTLFGAESGSVYLSDTDNPTYRRRAAWGPRSRDKMRAAEVNFAEGFGDLVMRSRTEVITGGILAASSRTRCRIPALRRRPLLDLGAVLGQRQLRSASWACAAHLGYEYSSNDENLLVAISRQLATTIEKVRLYEETCRAYEDLRKTQEQLLQSEKMSAVGQLIAGVAHELNNPLTAILGYAQLARKRRLEQPRSGLCRQAVQAGPADASCGAKPAVVRPPAQAAARRSRRAQGARRNPRPARLRPQDQQYSRGARSSSRASRRGCRSAPDRAGISEHYQ